MIVEWRWSDEDEVHACTLTEWLEANEALGEDALAEVEDELRADGRAYVGGGASPVMILRRVG